MIAVQLRDKRFIQITFLYTSNELVEFEIENTIMLFAVALQKNELLKYMAKKNHRICMRKTMKL